MLLKSHPCRGLMFLRLPAAFGTVNFLLMLFDWIVYFCQLWTTDVTCHSGNPDVTLPLPLTAKEAISMLPKQQIFL